MDFNHEWNNCFLHLNSHTNSIALENTTAVIAHGDEFQPQILSIHTRNGIQGSQH
jgi:hypothetical protein